MKRLEHRWSARRLDSYTDGELGVIDATRLATHLDDCPDCAAHVRFLLRIRAALRRLP